MLMATELQCEPQRGLSITGGARWIGTMTNQQTQLCCCNRGASLHHMMQRRAATRIACIRIQSTGEADHQQTRPRCDRGMMQQTAAEAVSTENIGTAFDHRQRQCFDLRTARFIGFGIGAEQHRQHTATTRRRTGIEDRTDAGNRQRGMTYRQQQGRFKRFQRQTELQQQGECLRLIAFETGRHQRRQCVRIEMRFEIEQFARDRQTTAAQGFGEQAQTLGGTHFGMSFVAGDVDFRLAIAGHRSRHRPLRIEQLHHLPTTRRCRQIDRTFAITAQHMRIGSEPEQGGDGIGIGLLRLAGQMQGSATLAIAMTGIRLAKHQTLQYAIGAGAGSFHQRSDAMHIARIDIAAGIDQDLGDFAMSVQGRHVQGRAAELVGGAHISARLQQTLEQRRVVLGGAGSGNQYRQRTFAIALRATFDQQGHHRFIAGTCSHRQRRQALTIDR